MNGTTLKLIAIASMVFDHIGTVFFPEITMFRLLGRISLPIFVFLLTEGFSKTNNKSKYAQRLFVFGIISIVPHSLAFFNKLFCFSCQNIFFTLLITFVMLCLFDQVKANKYRPIVSLFILILVVALSVFLRLEYAVVCPLMATIFYTLKEKRIKTICCLFISIIIGYTIECYFIFNVNLVIAAMSSVLELIALLAIIPLLFYNGEKGNMLPKYFFYWFYPIHLIVIYVIHECII